MKLFCKLFGHRWHYHFSAITGSTKYRSCRCGRLDQYIRVAPPFSPWAWVMMITYTDKGAKEMLADLPKGATP
jgi:hypothetical protein